MFYRFITLKLVQWSNQQADVWLAMFLMCSVRQRIQHRISRSDFHVRTQSHLFATSVLFFNFFQNRSVAFVLGSHATHEAGLHVMTSTRLAIGDRAARKAIEKDSKGYPTCKCWASAIACNCSLITKGKDGRSQVFLSYLGLYCTRGFRVYDWYRWTSKQPTFPSPLQKKDNNCSSIIILLSVLPIRIRTICLSSTMYRP